MGQDKHLHLLSDIVALRPPMAQINHCLMAVGDIKAVLPSNSGQVSVWWSLKRQG